MIAGELDLSVGSVLASSSMTLAIVSGYWGAPIIVGIVAALALGLAIGFLNGFLVMRTEVPSFIVTLGLELRPAGPRPRPLGAHHRYHQRRARRPVRAKHLFGTLIADKFQVTIFWWIA